MDKWAEEEDREIATKFACIKKLVQRAVNGCIRKAKQRRLARAKLQTPEGQRKKKAYRRSEAGIGARNRANNSEKGKAAHKKSRQRPEARAKQMKWRTETEKGQAYVSRNRKTDAAKESVARHRKTDKWAATKERFYSKKSNRIAGAICTRLGQILKGSKSKSMKSITYTGCASADELMDYLMLKPQDGMTRDNFGWGGWVVDHIIPRVLYDHEDEAEIFRCWNKENLRPCWRRANASKGAKLIPELVHSVPQELWPKAWGGVCPV